ncbi:MAG: fatty acid desaturase [Saprospiraceae bacterium]
MEVPKPLYDEPIKGVNTPYDVIDTPDIHFIRGAKVLEAHPEVKQLMGYDPWAPAVVAFIVFAQLGCCYLVGRYCTSFSEYWWQILLLSYFVGGTLSHWAGMGIHECAHNLMARTTVQNYLIAIFANTAIGVPSAIQFRRHHLLHHSHLGIENIDNDFPSHFEAKWIGKNRFLKFIWLFFYVFFITMVRGFLVKPGRWEWFNIAYIVLVDVLIFYFFGPVAFAYLMISTFWGYSFHPTAGHFIHEHFIFKEGQETNSYYGILNHVCFYVGYHNEHHDIMNIPGRYLPKYYKMTREFYDGMESTKSWTHAILWHFIVSPTLGADSRYVRNEAVREKGISILNKMRRGKTNRDAEASV